MKASAIAHSNTALVKYWGKLSRQTNVPAVGSISVTLDQLWTKTRVKFSASLKRDRLILNEATAGAEQLQRVSNFLEMIRSKARILSHCEVRSENNFPTAAGLASSASAFASLALAATNAAGICMPPDRLSALARMGSGSAARSIYGGFVELPSGSRSSSDPHASQLADERYWPISVLVCITSKAAKPLGSSDAMIHTAAYSPYYDAWIRSSAADLESMRTAIRDRDLETVGGLAEHSALKLHALLMSSKPGLIYWNQGTLAVIDKVRAIRSANLPAYFTIDAGPQVKVICHKSDSDVIAEQLRGLAGVHSIIKAGPGPSARLIEGE